MFAELLCKTVGTGRIWQQLKFVNNNSSDVQMMPIILFL